MSSRDHAAGAVIPPDELKLAEQEGLELLVGWIMIGIFIFAGIFGQWVYGLCEKIGNPRIRKAARAFGKIVGFTLTTALFYFATRVGVKASLYGELPKAGDLRTEWHNVCGHREYSPYSFSLRHLCLRGETPPKPGVILQIT